MFITRFAIGVVLGVALCTSSYFIQATGLWPILRTASLGLYLLALLQPFNTLCAIIGAFGNFKKRSGLRMTEPLLSTAILSVILLFGLYLSLYSDPARVSESSPLHEWLMFAGSDAQSLAHLATSEAKALWFKGVSLSSVSVGFWEIYGPLFQRAVSWSAPFLFCLPPIYLTWWACSWVHRIYVDFTQLHALGLAEPLPTVYGWAVARLQVWLANVDVLRPPYPSPMLCAYGGRLESLPQRDGPRPTILSVAQRQIDQRAPLDTMAKLEHLIDELVEQQLDEIDIPRPAGSLISKKPSFLQSNAVAIRRNLDDKTNADVRGTFSTEDEFGGEIFHANPDGTSHAVLHPNDARIVMEAGWGQLHPLATRRWYWHVLFHSILGVRCPAPANLVLLYAPRNEGELSVVRDIVIAAIWNESQGDLFPLRADTHPTPPAPVRVN